MHDDITIRKTAILDIPVIMELLKEVDFLADDALYDTPGYFSTSVEQGIFFVAETREHNVVGLIHGERLMCDGAVIWYFVVEEQYRGNGIGKMLLTKFEEHCINNKIRWIFGTSDINDKTMNFYKSNKYKFEGKYIEFTKSL